MRPQSADPMAFCTKDMRVDDQLRERTVTAQNARATRLKQVDVATRRPIERGWPEPRNSIDLKGKNP